MADATETAQDAAGESLTDQAIPHPRHDMAVFLDFDGTLVDIAPAPDAIVVPPDLPRDLRRVCDLLGGAVAIVSGRPLSALDRYLGSAGLVFVGEHGAIRRLPGDRPALEASEWPAGWDAALDRFAADYPALVVERKLSGITLHYRLAPDLSEAARRLGDELIAAHPEYAIFPAKMAWEIRHRDIGKASAVKFLMTQPPFAGRIPVFIGDDIADEAAIAVVSRMGGHGLHMAKAFGSRPARVREWLKSFSTLGPENS
ncbi:MAG: trehalose-phosphatase [Rhizobiales bacterium]|nr:trehalose-phosphatase [Hyphomicrobiales bacterium]